MTKGNRNGATAQKEADGETRPDVQDQETENGFRPLTGANRLSPLLMKPRTTTCENPYTGKGQAFGCGRCLPCRLKKRREWTHRIMLEAGQYQDNSFVTLTYADDPYTLEPMDHRRFMDALRKRLKPLQVRFYAVGEYGDKNERPHFHYALFGYPPCKRNTSKRGEYRCCAPCDVLEEVWGKGLIKNLALEIGSARYIARYVVKKMTRWDDPRLHNRHPEFARMSLKPGIGHGALKNIAAVIARYDLLDSQGDVPVTLRHGSQQWPLGRYLRKKLRKELGLDERSPSVLSPEAAYQAFISDTEMRRLQQIAIADPENPSLKYHLIEAGKARREQVQKRLNMFLNKKGSL